MNTFYRRALLKAGAIASVASVAPGLTFAANPVAPQAQPQSAKQVPDTEAVTRILAAYLVRARYEDLPANVRKEGCRTLLNWVGVAVGGSHHETVERAITALKPF